MFIMQRVRPFFWNCFKNVGPNYTAARSMTSVNQDHFKAKPFDSIPGPKGIYQWPIIGSVLNFKPFTKFTPETFHDFLNDKFNKYGPIVKLYLGSQVVAVSDPTDFEAVYRNEGRYPMRPSIDLVTTYCKRNGIKVTMTHLQGTDWHTLRAPVNKRLMKADSATHYLEKQNAVADKLVQILESKKMSPEEYVELFYRYASESIAVVTFNKRLGLLDENPDKDSLEFLDATKITLHTIQDAVFGKSIAHKWYRNSTYTKFETAHNLIRKVTFKHLLEARKIIEDRMKAGVLSEDEPNLLFSLLSEKNLDNEDVCNIITSLYGAGTDSTAKYVQVFFYNLAKNPDKQEILRKEILDILGPDGPLTPKALSHMVYLKAALKESFRLNLPTASGTIRILPVDVTLSGYNVPAGVQIMMGTHPPSKSHFENHSQFLPERWLRSEETVKKDAAHNMIVLPFGHGPRNCIGRRFAVQEIYLAAVKVLQRLNIDVHPESFDTKFIYKLFIEAETPIKFHFTKLN